MTPKTSPSFFQYLHPWLMVLYPILQFYSRNINELQLFVIIKPLLICLIINLFLWGILYLIPKTRHKSSLFLTLFWFFFFSHGHFARFIFKDNAPTLAELFYGFIFLLLVYILMKTASDLTYPQKALSIILLVLTLIPFSHTILYTFQRNNSLDKEIGSVSAFPQELEKSLKEPVPGTEKPDIYYLIFDRYGSSNTLKQFFDFSNAEFDSQLEKRGFYIAKKSLANYPATFLSLASSLNLRYLDEVSKIKNSRDKTYAYHLIQEAMVHRYLKAQGYSYIHIGSWWDPTRSNRYADKNIPFHRMPMAQLNLNEFEIKLLETTWLDLPIRLLLAHINKESQASHSNLDAMRTRNQIKAVIDSTLERGPKYVFCHFLLTHPPYFFNADGSLNPVKRRDSISDTGVYVDSIRFANNQILSIIDAIDKNSKGRAVVILQADEGPYSTLIKPDEEWENYYTRLRFRSQIINALRIPGITPEQFYPELSPVNIFRLVFNALFATQFPILPDRALYVKSSQDIYTFTDETQYIRQNEEYFETNPMNE